MKKKASHHTSESRKSQQLSMMRLSHFIVFTLLLFGGVVARAYQIQITDHETYKNLASAQHTRELTLRGERGGIFMRDLKSKGLYPVAINKRVFTVAIDAKTIADSSEENQIRIRDIVETRFQVDSDQAKGWLDDDTSQWRLIQRGVELELVEDLLQDRPRGLILQEQKERIYPEKDFASSLIGYVQKGESAEGKYGIEQQYNEVLRGTDGYEKKESDKRGVWLAMGDRDVEQPKQGSDVVLTIDHTIQFKVEEALKTLVERFSPKKAMGIVMDPSTGQVLAMASAPNFDPNNYGEAEDLEIFRNPIVSSRYEPGSIFKPFTVGLGLEQGVISPETEYVDTGEVTLNGFTIRNARKKIHGKQSMQYALDFSLNTGMVFIQQQLGRDTFVNGLIKKFQFGSRTGIDLPTEEMPDMANIQKSERDSRDINYATASYGQGIALTPLQILTAFNAIANDGVIMKPHVVGEIRNPDGTIVEVGPQEIGRALSPDSTEVLTSMMVSTVDNGHGKGAAVQGFTIGGKTGTAQIAQDGTYGDETLHSFIQFATKANPRYTILISLDSPQGVNFSDSSVVPVVGELNEFMLKYFEIEPDRVSE